MVNKYGRLRLTQNMPTWTGKKSTVALHPNYDGNGSVEAKYETEYSWKKSQFYQGEFFRDSIHGQGTYRWDDLAVFEGSFYSNYKEGYASVSFNNNCYFEGLFVRNKPFGPGIYTYANGRQDAGFWRGRKLVRLSRAADYIIPRLAPTSAAKIKLLQFRRLIPLDDLRTSTDDILEKYRHLSDHFPYPYSTLIYDPRSVFFDKQIFEKTYFVNITQLSKEFSASPIVSERETDRNKAHGPDPDETPIPPHCQCSREVFEMTYSTQDVVDICDRASTTVDSQTGILYNLTKYGTMERPEQGPEEDEPPEADPGPEEEETLEERSKAPKIVSWNRSELCTEMLKQIFRYRAFEDKLNFNLAKLMIGARTAFRRTGLREKECLHFLKMCSLGPPHVVKDLLCSYEISEELMDARGNNSLMFAAATDQLDIIDILLDYGVDVNGFNDEGLTPLNLCLLRRLAQAHKISNWETAYLPKEIDQTLVPETDSHGEAWECQESIPSLDRVFGDGMSMNDSKTLLLDNRFLSPSITSPSFTKDHSDRTTARPNRNTEDSKATSSLSQITVLNLVRSPKSVANNSLEDVTQSNRSQTVTNRSRPLGSNDPTPKADGKIVVKTNKREEFERSVMKTRTDTYLFEFSFEKKPPVVVGSSRKKEDTAKSGKGKTKKEEPVKMEVVEEEPDPVLLAKIEEIDRTIQKLLRRGADPNISEVPKPSIHLAIYTKHLPTVRSLLSHGACPDSQLYPNEGLLTPLHVLVLLKPSPEFVLITELFLSFGANPEEETRAEFSISEEEKAFLDAEQGRTPLQLLCMRPDVEHADPNDDLIKITLMLAQASNKRHFYKGHSCLTLAMHFGNLKLLKALLGSKHFDPNDVLGKDLGTALHVLLSTEFQKTTVYETSIKICDLLLEAGADPTKKFKSPPKLAGTCIDYGYREIEDEKEARKVNTPKKKDAGKSEKKEKGGGRDHLKDHVRVIEYLKEVLKRKKDSESDVESKSKGNDSAAVRNAKKSSEGGRRVDLSGVLEKESQGKAKERLSTVEDSKKRRESAGTFDESKSKDDKTDKAVEKRSKNEERETEDKKKKQREADDDDSDGKKDPKVKDKGKRDRGSKDLDKGKGIKDADKGKDKGSKDLERVKDMDKGKDKGSKDLDRVKDKGSKDMDKGKDKGSKDTDKGTRRTDSNFLKSKTKSLRPQVRSETFPEKVRQNLLRMFGSCINIDVNELLLPYVVLRDGELYYRFQGKGSSQKEQYSLI